MHLYYIEYKIPDDDFYGEPIFTQTVVASGVRAILDDLEKYGNILTKIEKQVDNIQIIKGKNE